MHLRIGSTRNDMNDELICYYIISSFPNNLSFEANLTVFKVNKQCAAEGTQTPKCGP